MSNLADLTPTNSASISFVMTFRPFSSAITMEERISSALSRRRASPAANDTRERSTPSSNEMFSARSPSGEVTARPMRRSRLSSLRLLRTNTRQRESSALLSANEGFSVVAPMNITVPFSIRGRNASCCVLLKRWTSSTKSTVERPRSRLNSASFAASLMSAMPAVTAEMTIDLALTRAVRIFASVVLPVPFGPLMQIKRSFQSIFSHK